MHHTIRDITKISLFPTFPDTGRVIVRLLSLSFSLILSLLWRGATIGMRRFSRGRGRSRHIPPEVSPPDKDAISIDLWPHQPPPGLPSSIHRRMEWPLRRAFFHSAANHHPFKMNNSLATILLVLVLSTVYADVVHWTPCPPSSRREYPLCAIPRSLINRACGKRGLFRNFSFL